MEDQISKSFENSFIRTAWNEAEEEWYFSVVDVVGVLTESPNPNNYWKVLKNRLKKEGSQVSTISVITQGPKNCFEKTSPRMLKINITFAVQSRE